MTEELLTETPWGGQKRPSDAFNIGARYHGSLT